MSNSIANMEIKEQYYFEILRNNLNIQYKSRPTSFIRNISFCRLPWCMLLHPQNTHKHTKRHNTHTHTVKWLKSWKQGCYFSLFRVATYCENKGWQRIYDKTRDDYKLKWCETRSMATYYNFKEGEYCIYLIFSEAFVLFFTQYFEWFYQSTTQGLKFILHFFLKIGIFSPIASASLMDIRNENIESLKTMLTKSFNLI